ncbi:hypothetical protein C4588_02905 [Candidatus Parcubacteria bacterium]|nr:MAG: hypothetical protein C4588_02905 [Candidatus Parcubacteria bacterium]
MTMTFIETLSNWLRRKDSTIVEYVAAVEAELSEPFCRFPCDCKEQITLFKAINPGEAAVIECDNCGLSWTVYNPTLIIKKTKELPENLQAVWARLSNEPI